MKQIPTKQIPTMTVAQLLREFRELGVSKSQDVLVEEIERGIYPFAQAIQMPGSCKHVVTIYTKLFDRWVQERAVEVTQ